MPSVLIIDEEPLQRLLVREILGQNRFLTFLEASGAVEALRLTQVHHPSVIILDLGDMNPEN